MNLITISYVFSGTLLSAISFAKGLTFHTTTRMQMNISSRRDFFSKGILPTTLGLITAGIIQPIQNVHERVFHEEACTRNFRLNPGQTDCSCSGCASKLYQIQFRVPEAQAFDRDVGADGSRSPETAAMNIQVRIHKLRKHSNKRYLTNFLSTILRQAKKTNARLEKEGFKLDTREEEHARLASAMASFSYESANSNIKNGGKKVVNRSTSKSTENHSYTR